MTHDQNANRTQGETHGQDQEPIEAAERDTVQQRQARHEGEAPAHDPAAPDAGQEDSIRMATSPDAAYGRREGQAGEPEAGMPTGGGESQAPGGEFVPRDEG